MSEMSDFEELDIILVLEVRVLDKTKKNSFRVRRLTNFPTAETLEDMKNALKMFMPDIQPAENWKIGYVFERNKKYLIESDVKLRDAIGHFQPGYQMRIDPSPGKTSSARNQTTASVQGLII